MMKRLVIIYAGIQGRIVAETAEICDHHVAGFIDDTLPQGSFVGPYKVLGGSNLLESNMFDHQEYKFAVAIGDPSVRHNAFKRLENKSYEISEIIHPNSFISRNAELGRGIFVNCFASIFSGARIDDFVLIDNHASVGVDCIIGKSCFIGPGAHINSRCSLGDECFLGSCAAINPKISIGHSSLVGSNSTVIKDVPAASKVVGNPARAIGL